MEAIRRQQVGLSADIINLNMPKPTERQGRGEDRESSLPASERTVSKEDEKRIAELKKKRKELEKSTEKTAEAVRKAAEALRQAAREKSSGKTSQIKELPEEEQGAVIVESMPHLWVLPAEKVNAILEEQGVKFRVDPSQWDNENVAERFLLLENNGVANTTKLPTVETEPKEIYKDNKVSVYQNPDGEYVVTGSLENMEPDEISKILEKAGVDKKLSKSKGWDKLSFQEQRDELRKQGVRVMPAIAGGSLPTVEVDAQGRVVSIEEPPSVHNFSAAAESLRTLSTENAFNTTNPRHAEWQAAQARLRTVLGDLRRDVPRGGTSGANYYEVSRIADDVRSMDISASTSTDYAATLNRFLSKSERDEILKMPEELDRRLRKEYEDLDTETKRAIFGDLDVAIDSSVKAMISFGYPWDSQHQVKLIAQEKSASYGNYAKLIEWRVERARTDANRSLLEALTKAPPTDWRDSRNSLASLFRNVESVDYTVQELSAVLQRGNAIIEKMPVDSLSGAEKAEAERVKQEMNDQLEATQSLVQFFKTMEDESMNPDKVQAVFKTWKDNTLKVYFERFTRDEEGRDIADPRPDRAGGKLNLLDEAMKVYMKKFNQERREMNVAEELTKIDDISGRLSSGVLDSIKGSLGGKLLEGDEAMIERVRARLAQITKDKGKDWTKASDKKEVISDWYRIEKVLGAHGFATREQLLATASEAERRILDEEFQGSSSIDLMAFRKLVLGRELKEKLKSFGSKLTEEEREKWEGRVDKMDNAGILNQVSNNGQKMAWNFAWSDYDGIRVWDMNANKEAIGGSRGMVTQYVYNQATGMFYGRASDHLWEFYVDEGRGKIPQTNLIFQRAMLGDRGNFLPQNRTMVRFIGKFAEIKGLKHNGEVVNGSEAFRGEGGIMDKKRKSLKNHERLDLKDKDEGDWARSAAYGEMIDSGEISFENADWSKMLGNEEDNISQYSMIDLYGDRASQLKYTGGDVFQKYLQQPNTKLFLDINTLENFYSKRGVRIKPWMRLAIPAHQEIGRYWKKWFKLPYDMPNAEAEHIIDTAVSSNRLEASKEGKMKRDYLGVNKNVLPGFVAIRRVIQAFEFSRTVAKETGKRAWILPLILFWALIKGALGQSQAQLAGK